MEKELDIRLQADRLLVEYLSLVSGKSASALAAAAGMAPTTLNRFVSKSVKPKSVLKDSTIQKIAMRWGFVYLDLIAYREKTVEALRAGKTPPAMHKIQAGANKAAGLAETPESRFDAPPRDPLLDRIMGIAYEAWFNGGFQKTVAFDQLPDLVRLLHSRSKSAARPPSVPEIKKRAIDMLSALAMQAKGS